MDRRLAAPIGAGSGSGAFRVNSRQPRVSSGTVKAYATMCIRWRSRQQPQIVTGAAVHSKSRIWHERDQRNSERNSAGTAGATTAASPAFQLTNATVAAADGAANVGETATDSPKAAAGQTFRLIANPTALSPHVGKKLALTGTLEQPDPATASAPTAADSEAKGPALRVESGKILAESCNQQ
jgi:hypothetical protein